jgi:DNA-binding response OmpR family regulator
MQNPRILLVDDERAIADAVGMMLEMDGFRVNTAYAVGEADSKLSNDIGLLVTDFNLLDGDARGVVKNARQKGYNGPILVYSGIRENALHFTGMSDVSFREKGVTGTPYSVVSDFIRQSFPAPVLA